MDDKIPKAPKVPKFPKIRTEPEHVQPTAPKEVEHGEDWTREDEIGWESFPSSDPPSSYAGRDIAPQDRIDEPAMPSLYEKITHPVLYRVKKWLKWT